MLSKSPFFVPKTAWIITLFFSENRPPKGGAKNHIAFLAGNRNFRDFDAWKVRLDFLRFSGFFAPRGPGEIWGPIFGLRGQRWRIAWNSRFSLRILLFFCILIGFHCDVINHDREHRKHIKCLILHLKLHLFSRYPYGMMIIVYCYNYPILRLKITDLLSLKDSRGLYNKCSLYNSLYSRIAQICSLVRRMLLAAWLLYTL